MADYVANAVLAFGAANSVAGLLVNPVGSGVTITVKSLAAMATLGHVPNALVRRYVGATHESIGPQAPVTMPVSSASAAAKGVPTTSTSHTYDSLGTVNFEIAFPLYAALETQLVLAEGESLGIVMAEDGSGAEALFAVRWSE